MILALLLTFSGCSKSEDVFIYKSVDNEWSIEIPSTYEKENEEKLDGFYYVSYKNDNGDMFTINEIVDKETVLDEKTFKEELEMDDYFHVERFKVLKVEGYNDIYSAALEDHSTNAHMLYFKTRINDKLVAFLALKTKPFTEKEEAKITSMVANIK